MPTGSWTGFLPGYQTPIQNLNCLYLHQYLPSGLVNFSDYSPICVFFSDFSYDPKYPNPSSMICNFSNFQHGARHDACDACKDGGASNVGGSDVGGILCDGGHLPIT